MRGFFKFDENPAVVSLRADLASYGICSLVRAKVSRMCGKRIWCILRTAPLSLAVSRVTPEQPNGKNSIFKYYFIVANTYLVSSDNRAGKACHTPCYLIVCGFKRRQRSTSPRLASVFIRAVSNTKLCRPCVLKYIVEAEGTSLRGPWSYFFLASHKKVE